MHRAVAQTTPTNQKYSETVFATTFLENNAADKLLRQGARAFIIANNLQNSDIEQSLKAISNFLSTHPQVVITVIVKQPINPALLRKWLLQNGLDQSLYFKSRTENWPLLSEMIAKNKRLVLFTTTPCANCFSLNMNLFFSDFNALHKQKKGFTAPTDNALLCYAPFIGKTTLLTKQDTTFRYRSFLPWKQRGIVPSFIISSNVLMGNCVEVADSINSTVRYAGRIIYNNELLKNVRWPNFDAKVTNGAFTFPESGGNYDLYTPWKEGYKFYPEVVKFERNHLFQEFVATKLELNDNLVYHFRFEKESQNTAENTAEKNLVFNTQFKTVSKHGKVAVFDKEGAAIQCENNRNFDTDKAFTVSVWVKPYKVDGIHTIVSKGQVFSAKIRKGGLSFAGTGFPSRITNTIKIKPNEWQHLSWICVPNYHVQFFVNGKLMEEMEFKTLVSSDQSVTIGNNFSNEDFKGEMDELHIWNRALSSDEIAEVYQQKTHSNLDTLLLLGICGCVVVLLSILYRKRKKQNTKKPAPTITATLQPTKLKQAIFVFGPLSMHNELGEELTQQLTPKVKQLLLLLLIHKNGLSISRLNEEFWPGIDEEKAKQNRNYCIQQLKKMLAKIAGADIEYQSKNWVLTISDNVYVDIIEHEKLAKLIGSSTEQNPTVTSAYISLVERGKFMQGVDIEAFDQYKAKISNQITDCLLLLAINADSKTRLRMGNALLLHDSLQEDGLRLSLKSLTELGRNGEAHEIYNSFCKKYKNTYNEDFSSTFSSFI